METPYTFRDMQNAFVLDRVVRVMKAARSIDNEKVLVEEVGTGLIQHDWRDETWDYVKFRGVPIWVSRHPERREAMIQEFVEALKAELGVTKVDVFPMGPDPEDRIVARWNVQTHKVMD